jgi:hypothetical protein
VVTKKNAFVFSSILLGVAVFFTIGIILGKSPPYLGTKTVDLSGLAKMLPDCRITQNKSSEDTIDVYFKCNPAMEEEAALLSLSKTRDVFQCIEKTGFNYSSVRFILESGDFSGVKIFSKELVEGIFSGTVSSRSFWNKIYNMSPNPLSVAGISSKKQDMIAFCAALGFSGLAIDENNNAKFDIKGQDWQKKFSRCCCILLVASKSTKCFLSDIEASIDDGTRKFFVKTDFKNISSLSDGKLSPDELSRKIHMEWNNKTGK